ncbi:hypothetical protein [Stackebrandtia nassauensis]|uniref:Uncharacterized protein n=1 Tax=Stackebrandtia nassauensis (strain DSM 44728 / CIP 108903 / NRRL B-16338 / NBRC 102104 / LLR-40K-21) TaxID=446470 RepID=D3Q389_STANL|nr:hypothetical protein [Stackebrandtia nassauensis]ADD40059.1 hypothetical protein Snas_0341 [Stackebrandtia nassauensis DSM 44728]
MANTNITCRHGTTGFCWDDATPDQRKLFDYAHTHAYDWAIERGLARDDAERYAGASAAHTVDVYPDAYSHSLNLVSDLATKYPHVN